jgi:8-oxo-dGTP pyrophosphatase MutT (NUDIX family)
VGEGKKEQVVRAFSAGGAVYKKQGKKTAWLIIQPSGMDRWQLPKGLIAKGESSKVTAQREVEEEGGVKAKVVEKIGTSQFFFVFKGQKIFKTVTYYLMEYLSGSEKNHDMEVEDAVFLPLEEALDKLTFQGDKEILKKAKSLI